MMGVEPNVSPLGGKALEVGQPLRPTECLDVPVKHLIGGRPPGNSGKNINFIWIFHRRTVLHSQIRHDLGAQVAAMAGPARHRACSREVVLVEGIHHQEHSAGSPLQRGVGGEPFPALVAVPGMAIKAVHA